MTKLCIKSRSRVNILKVKAPEYGEICSPPPPLKWISDTVLSNFCCHANLADTPVNLVHNTKKLFYVKYITNQ